jgi:hypothetical protein
MAAIYEDNFGFWEIDYPQESAFFKHVQRQSLRTTCTRCERPVRLLPTKTICARCVSALECGAPASMKDYGHGQATRPVPRRSPRPLLRPRVP